VINRLKILGKRWQIALLINLPVKSVSLLPPSFFQSLLFLPIEIVFNLKKQKEREKKKAKLKQEKYKQANFSRDLSRYEQSKMQT
jgi:hypothetical protein